MMFEDEEDHFGISHASERAVAPGLKKAVSDVPQPTCGLGGGMLE
jgi:hypothetical protein